MSMENINGDPSAPDRSKGRKARPKKTARGGKRKPKSAATNTELLGKGKVVDTEKLEFEGRSAKGTQYQPVIDAVLKLKKGQSYIIPIGDTDPHTMRERLSAPFKAGGVQASAPIGYMFLKRITKAGQLVVSLVKRVGAGTGK